MLKIGHFRNRILRAALLGWTIGITWLSPEALRAQFPVEVEQRGLQQLMDETERSLDQENWLDAAERLNRAWILACENEDPLMVTTGADVRQLASGETEILAGGKARLEALFRNSPPAFRLEFTRQFADLAETQVTEALVKSDFDELRRLTVRYTFCPAARRGLLVLAKRSMDEGDFLEAAMLLGRLQRMNETPDAALLLQTALCYARAGLFNDAADLVNRVAAENGPRSVKLGGRDVEIPQSADATAAWLQRYSGMETLPSSDWLQPGGNYRRMANQLRGPARFRFVWKSNLFEVNDVLFSEQFNPLLDEFREPVEREALRLLQRNSTIIPTAVPLLYGGQAIIRTPFGIRSVNLESGELHWEVTRPDSRLRVIVDQRTNDNADRGDLWRNDSFRAQPDPRARLLYQMLQTNTAAQMAINGNTLFVVDECSGATWSDDFGMGLGGEGSLLVSPNVIRAYDVESGLFKWEAGGQTQNAARAAGRGNVLAGFYFLGAPLVLGQRTYVLAESGEGIFLIQIAEPGTLNETTNAAVNSADASSEVSVNPRIVRSQILAVPEHKLPQHPVRKYAGLVPSFAQGLLVCPTCDQRIVAVSAEDQSLRWIFRYSGNIRPQELGGDNLVLFGGRDAIDTRSVDLDSRWIDSLARIVDGKVLVTPRDSDQLYCLDLLTGRQLWKAPRSVFHAIGAVTSDRVILVGNQRVAALKMTDGSEIWTTEIRNGLVCGTSASNGTLIQIPTDEPAIVTLDMRDGRRVVRQSEDFSKVPGNLLMTEHGLLSQNLTAVTFSSSKLIDTTPSVVDRAAGLLLNGETSEAQQLLDQEVAATPGDSAAREMLIELLLEGLRSDFKANQTYVGRVRELIDISAREVAIAPLLHALLGMNLPDAAALPRQLHGRSNRYQGELSELIARGMESDTGTSQEDLTENIRQLLKELPAARPQMVSSGFMVKSKSTILCIGIRQAMVSRTAAEQRQIQVSLRDTAAEIMLTLPDDASRLDFLFGLLSCSMPELALTTIEGSDIGGRGAGVELLQEFARLEISQSFSSNAGAAANDLLDSWKAAKDPTAIRAWLSDLSTPVPGTTMRFQMPDPDQRERHLNEWKKSNPEFATPAASVWKHDPEIAESADRTMLDPMKTPDGIPDKLIPLYGPPGVYRDWSFVRVRPTEDLYAFDPDGVVRWKMRPYGIPDSSRFGFAADSYVVACGRLLIVNLSGTLFALDPARINKDGEPTELWRKNIARLSPDADAEQYREYIPPSARIPQYFPQPGGYFPAGPVTPLGAPVISGRRLIVFNPITGERTWQVDGIPRDVVLLCSGDVVLLISEGSRQIEVRSLVDGSVRSVSRLPEWWGEANANVGSSVNDFEVEDGVDLLWRIVLQGRSCLLFRLTGGKSVLENRDLLTDTVTWSIELPEATVFSNVAEDVVALLSEGKQLKLVHTDTGRILADLAVTSVTNPQGLILRHSAGHYVVLPESEQDFSDDFAPVIDAIYVAGRIYAIRDESMTLAWDLPLDHRHIRLMIPERSVLLPNVPVLLLLSRGGRSNPESPFRGTHYGALMIDVRNGKKLYLDDDVGATLNTMWMHIDADSQKILQSFDRRLITLDYSGKPAPPPEK